MRATQKLAPQQRFPCLIPGTPTYVGCKGQTCPHFDQWRPRKGCLFYLPSLHSSEQRDVATAEITSVSAHPTGTTDNEKRTTAKRDDTTKKTRRPSRRTPARLAV